MGELRNLMASSSRVVAAALVCVLITCATELDLDHPQIIELDTPQALTDASLPAEFSGRAKESSTDVAYAMDRADITSQNVEMVRRGVQADIVPNPLPTSEVLIQLSESDDTILTEKKRGELGEVYSYGKKHSYGKKRKGKKVRRRRGSVSAKKKKKKKKKSNSSPTSAKGIAKRKKWFKKLTQRKSSKSRKSRLTGVAKVKRAMARMDRKSKKTVARIVKSRKRHRGKSRRHKRGSKTVRRNSQMPGCVTRDGERDDCSRDPQWQKKMKAMKRKQKSKGAIKRQQALKAAIKLVRKAGHTVTAKRNGGYTVSSAPRRKPSG